MSTALYISGNYEQSSFIGTLQIELASPASFDRLDVTGNMKLGSTLEVSLAGGYVPHGSQSFDILDWGGGLSGTFFTLQLPTLDGALVWDTSQLYTDGILTVVGPDFLEADFDEDGDVDGDDLANWTTGFGTTADATHLQGNADGDADVDGGEYLVWQRQLGGMPAIASSAAVAEPSSAILFNIGYAAAAGLTRSRGLHRKSFLIP